MFFRITSDVDVTSGLGEIADDLSGPSRRFFQGKNYGDDLLGVGVVLMCRSDELLLKRRVRVDKREKKIYMDIMFSLVEMKLIDAVARKKKVVDCIACEVPAVIGKYNFAGFDHDRFSEDLHEWLSGC